MKKLPLIAIIGPTAAGKSDLAVQLAKKFNGEIVSADSRQVYKGLDIGSGKITKKEMMGVLHHLLDVASTRRAFTVARYQKLAFKAIRDIHKRGKLPFLVGGTPFYVYAVVDNLQFPAIKPNPKLRADLGKLSVEQLLAKLQKLDSERAKTIERKNKRRLIRALEIVITTGKPVPKSNKVCQNGFGTTPLLIGIKRSPEELRERIHLRLLKRLRQGMVEEVENLRAAALSWKRLEGFGLEYRNVAQYLQGKISEREMIENIQKQSEHFARRQMRWFKKDSRIHWISSFAQAEHRMQDYLQSG